MNILFISEVLPVNTFASSVIFYRHFERLVQDGHSVTVLTDENSFRNRSKDLNPAYHTYRLPNRKWYYPPYRPAGIAQRIRFQHYYRRYVKQIIQREKITHLVGFAHGQFLSAFTSYIKEKSGLPLVSFFHDDNAELNFFQNGNSLRQNTARLINSSNKVLIASDGFRKNWKEYSEKFELLYPIPEGVDSVPQKVSDISSLRFGYSGSVYNEILKPLAVVAGYFQKKGWAFHLIGNNEKSNLLAEKFDNIVNLPLFDTPGQANSYLLSHCDVCIIPYPENVSEMPWINTCFPSKLIQYCQLSLPTLIVAPKNSALGEWCLKNNWLLYSADYDLKIIDNLLNQYIGSSQLLEQIQNFKEAILHPANLHQQFVGALQSAALPKKTSGDRKSDEDVLR